MSEIKNSKQQKAILIFVLAICLISYIISCTMQDMQTSLREESNTQIEKRSITENVKQNVAFYWDAEESTAQQVERAVSYGGNEATEQIISNIQENIQYNRNKAAPLFYIAQAYEVLGKPDKAIETYNKIINGFNDHKIKLYILNSPRSAADNKTYSVSLIIEAKTRRALVNSNIPLLNEIADTLQNFGVEGKEAFLYSDVIKKNISAIYAKAEKKNTWEYYWRVFEAKDLILKFIALCLQENNEQAKNEIDQIIRENQNISIENVKMKINELKDKEIEIDYIGMQKDGMGYIYSFKIKEINTIIDVSDNSSFLNISNIRL